MEDIFTLASPPTSDLYLETGDGNSWPPTDCVYSSMHSFVVGVGQSWAD